MFISVPFINHAVKEEKYAQKRKLPLRRLERKKRKENAEAAEIMMRQDSLSFYQKVEQAVVLYNLMEQKQFLIVQ